MPNEETSHSLKSVEKQEGESLRSLREFLKTKANEKGIRDRHRLRSEWLGAIRRLVDQILDWLRQSDPQGVLDIQPYEVARTELDLGTYDAPALKIRLGFDIWNRPRFRIWQGRSRRISMTWQSCFSSPSSKRQ